MTKGRGGEFTLLFFILILFPSLVSATCPFGVDCDAACGNTIHDSWETCDRTATPSGCGSDEECNDECSVCLYVNPCDFDINCEPYRGEDAVNCPSDCGDSDNDGVNNDDDACPNTPPGEPVNLNYPYQGCSCSQRSCGMQDCDYRDSVCRDYHDVLLGCSAGECLTSSTCSDFTNNADGISCLFCKGGSPCACLNGVCSSVTCTSSGDCPASGWTPTGSTRSTFVPECADQAEYEEAYTSYACVSNDCVDSVTGTQWLPDGTPLANQEYCGTAATCVQDASLFTCVAVCIPDCSGSPTCGQGDGCEGECSGTCAIGEECVLIATNDYGCSAVPVWYQDADADGYGNVKVLQYSQTQPAGYVADSTDCDDTNDQIHPDATEICNNQADDNCDGQTDEGCASCPVGDLTCNDGVLMACDGQTYAILEDDCASPGDYPCVAGTIVCAECEAGSSGCLSSHEWVCSRGQVVFTDSCVPFSCVGGSCGTNTAGALVFTASPSSVGGSVPFTLAAVGHDLDGVTSIVISEGSSVLAKQPCSGQSCSATKSMSKGSANTYLFTGVMTDTYGVVLTKTVTVTVTTTCTDDDGDGFTTCDGDCDDNNARINPKGTEICDAFFADEDCDGAINDDDPDIASGPLVVTGASQYFRDADGDEFGVHGTSLNACVRPEGYWYLTSVFDCDDANGDVNPSVGEVCNNIDDNCNGLTDGEDVDPDGFSYFLDTDGDGYGDVTTVDWCHGDAVTDNTDCDDRNPAVNPGVTETGALCGDKIDNDCDNKVDAADPGCAECADGICNKADSPSWAEWRQVELSCSEQRFTIHTRFIPNGCDPGTGNCAYETQLVETTTEETRPRANGVSCRNSWGYCHDGTCIESCPDDDQPGCLPSTPPGAFLLNRYACPQGLSCFSCPSNHLWNGQECQLMSHTISLPAVIATAGDAFLLAPITRDDQNNPVEVIYTYSGFRDHPRTTDPFEVMTKTTEVGRHEMQITAYRVTNNLEELIARKTIEIALKCPSDHTCCPDQGLNYDPPGTTCSLYGDEGTCNENGLCQPLCSNKQHENTATKCSDNIDNDCDGVYDCVRADDGSTESGCKNFCQAYCQPGQTACGHECVIIDTDHNHCGTCGNDCKQNEQCIQTTCTQIPGCYVACEQDVDCGEQQVCILPGTCDAYCEDVPIIILNESAQQDLLASVIRQKTFEIKKTLTEEALIIEITNLITIPLENFEMTITIPKTVTSSANNIGSNHAFEVLVDDPIIRTTIPEIIDKRTVTFDFSHAVDPELVEFIAISATHDPLDLSLIDPLRMEDLLITKSFIEGTDGTTVKLTLTPGMTLENLRVPLEIPKCLANKISEMTFSNDNYAIINEDPLMVWTFDELSSTTNIEFSVPHNIAADCRDQLKAFGMATDKRKPVSPWLPLAIIPLIGFVLLFFQQFHEQGAKQHLTKNEFYKIGRDKEQTEEELNKEWHEYKRRF